MSNESVSYLCYLIRHNYSQLRRVQHDIKK